MSSARLGSRNVQRAATSRSRLLVLAATALAVALCGLTGTASAQSFDSLRCYKVRPQNGQWTVDLGNTMQPLTLTPFQAPPFSVEAGCRLVPQRNPRPRQTAVPATWTSSSARRSPSRRDVRIHTTLAAVLRPASAASERRTAADAGSMKIEPASRPAFATGKGRSAR
jgi:hypothetical protein